MSVPAEKEYAEPKRPLVAPGSAGVPPAEAMRVESPPGNGEAALRVEPAGGTPALPGELDIADVTGRRTIDTRFAGKVTVREENTAAALEVMSRFAADPRWLVYLPPTMSPCEASPLPDFLEHPAEAFGYFKQEGADRVVCEQKHMGSRAVAIVCKDEAAAARKFGVTNETGIVYTRTGRALLRRPGNGGRVPLAGA